MPEFILLVLRTFVAAVRSRRDLALENLVLRHQLQVALRTNQHPRLRGPDRVLWVWIRRLWPNGWRQHLHLVQPKTVLRWHRKGWRLYWTWKSRTRLGRPRLSAELKALIARIMRLLTGGYFRGGSWPACITSTLGLLERGRNFAALQRITPSRPA